MKTEMQIAEAKGKAISKHYPNSYSSGNRKGLTGFSHGWDAAIAFMQQTAPTQVENAKVGHKKFLSNGYYAHFDGSCNPNPRGDMGIGCYVYEKTDSNKTKIFEHSETLLAEEFKYQTSNNVAETLALDKLISWFLAEGMQDAPIVIYGDSRIVINACTASYASKGIFAPYMSELKKSVRLFSNLRLQWIPREQNEHADILSKMIS